MEVKNENGVGAGIAIFVKEIIEEKLKYKLHDNCSNNRAEQLAIVKAMEALENTNIRNSRRIVTIYPDSKVTIQSIKNYRNHNSLIKKLGKKH